MKSKQHGLWRFHRALREHPHNRIDRFRWWCDEVDLEKAESMVSYMQRRCMYGAYSHPYELATIVIRCAFRAMRRWNLPRNAGTWNALCAQIYSRCHFGNWKTEDAFTRDDAPRFKSPIYLSDEFDVPRLKIYRSEFIERVNKIKESRLQNKLQEQSSPFHFPPHEDFDQFRSFNWHGMELNPDASMVIDCVRAKPTHRVKWTTVPYRYSPLLVCERCGLIAGKRRIRRACEDKIPGSPSFGYWKCLCVGCGNTATALNRRWREADKLRIEINRTRRKLYESTKNNARTS